MSDVHDSILARIQAFLQQRDVVSLMSAVPAPDGEGVIKAGVVPFIRRREGYLYYLMKPVAKRPGLGAPSFQICKGTRMCCVGEEGWRDMLEGESAQQKETLAETALREGIEELGLKLEAISGLWDVGPYVFSSAKSGNSKHMWLFAAEMTSTEDVLPMEEVEKTTSERGWLTLDEFAVVGREDHRYIMADIAAKLKSFYLISSP